MNIKSDDSRLKIAVLILNQKSANNGQRKFAYRIIDSLTCVNHPDYEKNVNFLYSIDRQVAMNTIINRSVRIVTA